MLLIRPSGGVSRVSVDRQGGHLHRRYRHFSPLVGRARLKHLSSAIKPLTRPPPTRRLVRGVKPNGHFGPLPVLQHPGVGNWTMQPCEPQPKARNILPCVNHMSGVIVLGPHGPHFHRSLDFSSLHKGCRRIKAQTRSLPAE